MCDVRNTWNGLSRQVKLGPHRSSASDAPGRLHPCNHEAKRHSPEALTLAIAGGQMLWAGYWHASPCISCARSGSHALA